LSPKQGRVQRPGTVGRLPAFDGDKSPAESADKSAHSKVVAAAPPREISGLALLLAAALAGSVANGAVPRPAAASTNHWAFQPVTRPAIPSVRNKSWPRTPIDFFILAKLDEKGLVPSPPADKATLLRRVTFDLHGLPPTPAELDAFLADASPDAFAKAVDRLLASPRYGERWARHWLDLARFSESDGFEYDKMREHAWRYRDYVIRSLNEDKPYARFVAEQIAGDALEPVTLEGIAATGFLVAGPYDEAGNSSVSLSLKARIREEEMEDIIAAVGQTFLGVTVNCARCHDHKFDPISQTDYYRLKAALDGVRHGNRPFVTPSETRARNERLRGEMKPAPSNALVYAVVSREPEPTFVLARGDVDKKGAQVSAGALAEVKSLAPEFGLPPDAPEAGRRARLAEWVTDPGNPLTWRVIVNRIWQHHFGRGLAGTPNDFGAAGDRPSHPELLDWLAVWFRDDAGGSLKKLHRLIVTSATYRRASTVEAFKRSSVEALKRRGGRVGGSPARDCPRRR
jgi:hypothetical protein